MTEIDANQPPKHQNAHAAMHPPWQLRKESAIFLGNRPYVPNLVPIADEVHNWLQRKGHISLITERERGQPLSYTNLYTYSATSLAAQLASTINQIWDFAVAETPIDPIDAELQRIRLESELILQFARFIEAAMKQMLYCTTIAERYYTHAAMGQLLAFDCSACRKEGNPHYVSMLGALAHHYFDCHVLENCLFDHLAFVGRQRNKRAAHSESEVPRFTSVADSRAAAKQYLEEVGGELGHMCQHIGEIERKMLSEISLWITHHPNVPPNDEFMRIPVRIDDVFGV